MNPDIDLKSLWGKQEIGHLPDFKVILTEAGALKKKMRNRIILLIALLTATIVVILLIVYNAHPKMITTKIGMIITIIAMVLYIVTSGSILPVLYKSNPGNNTSEYLKQLMQVKRKYKFIHKTIFTLYFILLTGGIFLYLLEYVQMYSLFGKVLTYGIIALWVAFNWFYTRKRRIAKEQTEINQMVSKLEALSGRITEE